MSYTLKNKLVVAVASSALFDLKESDAVFQKDGEDKYREYQRENENNTLSTGVAFPLVKRLLALNAESVHIPYGVANVEKDDTECMQTPK